MALPDHGPLPEDRNEGRAVRRRLMPPEDLAVWVVSMECQHINRRYSWVRPTGQRTWVCPTCSAVWHLIPLDLSYVFQRRLTDEHPQRVWEVSYHAGAQVRFGIPHECDRCYVEWHAIPGGN